MKNLIFILSLTIVISSCSSDNETSLQNTNTLNFSELMTFQTDTLDIDMISHHSENSIYITHSAIVDDIENIIKYNLTTLTPTTLSHYDLSESRQIIINGDNLFSLGTASVYKMDLDLGNLTTVNSYFFSYFYPRVINYGDEIIISFGINNLVSYNTITYESSGQFNSYSNARFRADGEIYNNTLYIFGGSSLFRNIAYNEINMHNMVTNTWSQETFPFSILESFTSLYNDSIIVAGNKGLDSSNAFIGVYNIVSNTFIEYTTSLDIENISIRGITVLNDEIFLAYVDLTLPMPDLFTVKVAKATLN